jgi:hypothetical protein
MVGIGREDRRRGLSGPTSFVRFPLSFLNLNGLDVQKSKLERVMVCVSQVS